uniref:Uncharacterized protein n=1 Tax=Caenorhabditis japonica TaxID=281687 RepID=A0A8R1EEM7_CAEJA
MVGAVTLSLSPTFVTTAKRVHLLLSRLHLHSLSLLAPFYVRTPSSFSFTLLHICQLLSWRNVGHWGARLRVFEPNLQCINILLKKLMTRV